MAHHRAAGRIRSSSHTHMHTHVGHHSPAPRTAPPSNACGRSSGARLNARLLCGNTRQRQRQPAAITTTTTTTAAAATTTTTTTTTTTDDNSSSSSSSSGTAAGGEGGGGAAGLRELERFAALYDALETADPTAVIHVRAIPSLLLALVRATCNEVIAGGYVICGW